MVKGIFKGIVKFELELDRFNKRALPFATRNTINELGFAAQRLSIERIKTSLINRNKWTVQSIRVQKTKSLDINTQQSVVGSTADYMEVQEFGGVKVKRGKEGIPIATSYAAGLSQDTRPRTRLPTRANKLRNITLTTKSTKWHSRKQRNFVEIKKAAASGRKFLFLNLGTRQGIFRVIGGKKKPRIKMIYDLSHQSVRIPRKPWLFPSVKKTQELMPQIHLKSLQFQIDRLRLFRDK